MLCVCNIYIHSSAPYIHVCALSLWLKTDWLDLFLCGFRWSGSGRVSWWRTPATGSCWYVTQIFEISKSGISLVWIWTSLCNLVTASNGAAEDTFHPLGSFKFFDYLCIYSGGLWFWSVCSEMWYVSSTRCCTTLTPTPMTGYVSNIWILERLKTWILEPNAWTFESLNQRSVDYRYYHHAKLPTVVHI